INNYAKCFPIHCPGEKCTIILDQTVAQEALSRRDLLKYDAKRSEDTIVNKVREGHCVNVYLIYQHDILCVLQLYCPNSRCSYLMSLDKPELQNLARGACPKCKTHICIKCKSNDHPSKLRVLIAGRHLT